MQKVSGYDSEGPDGDPLSTGGNDVCPYCRLTPCVISRSPNWLRGSAQGSLSNQVKRFHLYKKILNFVGPVGCMEQPTLFGTEGHQNVHQEGRNAFVRCNCI